MIVGKRFVICGLSRLTTRVVKILAERGAEVVIVRGAEGLRILAFRRASGDAQPPSDLVAALEPGDEAIVAGPETTLRAVMLPLSADGTRAG